MGVTGSWVDSAGAVVCEAVGRFEHVDQAQMPQAHQQYFSMQRIARSYQSCTPSSPARPI